ncbi:L-aminoadipate-semialdehyde dehydrogenase-phosphopantetheinyl transferase [Schistocerca gregaria]|uniref:L-aminoadipate-semialdehyde dehydrogenase-phosphopantetheinyl transferase n=1 Tax=Schistocerca gregaria TaxID=7010 RepID=UPI00211E673B|nr:L-aminoadipate-semialdehyde dehydrogenase-phosphopantetheinyl transferase [Schistocerca gregaria]
MYKPSCTSLRVLLHTALVRFAVEKITIESHLEICGKYVYHTNVCGYNSKVTNCLFSAQNNGACLKYWYQVREKIHSFCFCGIVVALSDFKKANTFIYLPEIFLVAIKGMTQAKSSASCLKLSEFCGSRTDQLEGADLNKMEEASLASCEEDRVTRKSEVDSAAVSLNTAHVDGIAVSTDVPLETNNKQAASTSPRSVRCPERDLAEPVITGGQEQLASAKISAVKEMSVRWMFDVSSWCPSEAEWVSALSSVQPEECTRIRRFAFRRDARASLAGRLLARLFVSRALSIPWSAVRLERDSRGKPTVQEGLTDAKVSFSISHAGRWAVLAGEAGYGSSVADTVGVDTVEEKHRDAAHLLRIMKRNLSTVEQVSIEKAGRDGPGVFFRLWALKESYLKATGEGIGGGPELSELSFSFCSSHLPDTPGCVEVGTALEVKGCPLPSGWHFEESRIDPLHIVAVAVSGSEDNCCKMKSAPPVFQEISWNEFQGALESVTHHEPTFYLDYFNKPESPAYLQNTSRR